MAQNIVTKVWGIFLINKNTLTTDEHTRVGGDYAFEEDADQDLLNEDRFELPDDGEYEYVIIPIRKVQRAQD